jgi:hypothetical protein
MCPHTTACVCILLCVLILLYICPYPNVYLSSYYYICVCILLGVLILLYMCPHPNYCMCVLMLTTV